MEKKQVHIYSHTHWDQEWYFTTSRSRIYLFNHLKNVLRVLNNNEAFTCYLLDAQSSLVESYLQWAPEDNARLHQLIAEERLIVGPWYTQTDQLVIHQESVIRNLYYGMEIATQAGKAMPLGYVPDCFGQAGNMPQIYRQFGIHHALFWRGIADNTLSETEFYWQGDNGDRVFAVQMPWGYHYGGLIDERPETLKQFLDNKMAPIEARSQRQHLLYPHGFDQAPIRENLPELVRQFNECDDSRHYRIAHPLDFMRQLEAEVAGNCRVLQGELTEGKHSRIHKTIFSCRADLKMLNNQVEALLVNTLEPVLALSQSLGFDYPRHIVADIWKLMFANAAHDSIGGCNSDETNQDIYFRYKQARDMAQNLLELTTRRISQRIPCDHDYSFTVFNPLTTSVSPQIAFEAWLPGVPFTLLDDNNQPLEYRIVHQQEVTDYVLNQTIRLNPGKDIHIPEKVFRTQILVASSPLPPLGYTRWHMTFGEDIPRVPPVNTDQRAIENSVYRIEVEDDGLLTITHKPSARRYTRQMEFIDNGDDGDSYNYSPPRHDLQVSSRGHLLSLNQETDTFRQALQLHYRLPVPADLHERAEGRCSAILSLNVTLELQRDEMIRIQVEVDNQALSHRLCVHFATDIVANVSYADQLFGVITRPVQLSNALQVWEQENWQEKPVAIEPMQSYVNLHDDTHGFTLYTNGVREYEIVGEQFDTLSLTLFRTFGFMGKENLLWRPGRASGESIIATPDAQLLGRLTFSFAWRINSGSFDEAQHALAAKTLLTSFPVYQDSDFLNGRLRFCLSDETRDLPVRYSLFRLPTGKDHPQVSCVKCAEKKRGYIIRLYNANLHTSVTLPPVEAYPVMLDEHTVMPTRDVLRPCDLQTLFIPADES